MKKRSRRSHTGSVYQSGGWWYASIMINGRRVRRKAKTKAKANQKLAELTQQGEAIGKGTNLTVGALRSKWLKHIEQTKSSKTFQTYSLNVAVFDCISEIPVAMLQPVRVQECIDSRKGRASQLAHDKFKQMLRAGIKWKLVSRSNEILDSLERPGHESEKATPFTAEESNQIISEVSGLRYGTAITLSMILGLRGGEAWGLQWCDWNETAGTLRIDRQTVESGKGVEVKPPKRHSNRTLLLSKLATRTLMTRREQQSSEGLGGCEWVFPQLNGSPTFRTNFTARVWKPLLRRLNLASRGFHHVRHTYATLALNNGVPISVVSRNLGHKQISTTLDIYAHCMTHEREQYRDAMDDILGGTAE